MSTVALEQNGTIVIKVYLLGDIMGCGIIFPRDYCCSYDSDSSHELSPLCSPNVGDDSNHGEYEGGFDSESEDDLWWHNCNHVESGKRVQVSVNAKFFPHVIPYVYYIHSHVNCRCFLLVMVRRLDAKKYEFRKVDFIQLLGCLVWLRKLKLIYDLFLVKNLLTY